jgi:hypothetical protein
VKYFVPELAPNDELPVQSSLEEKFGGMPWGLPSERWPLCARCGAPQVLLAQLRHWHGRLDLGKEGRALFLFQCTDAFTRCPSWEMNSGANSCFVVDEDQLGEGLTSPSVSPTFPERRLASWLDEQVLPEWRVARWLEEDDTIPDLYPGFFGLNGSPEGDDEEQFETYQSKVSQETKLGSVPFWIQFPAIPPAGRFLGQIDSNCCQAFGDNGIGYIFLSGPASAPRGWFLWQCT